MTCSTCHGEAKASFKCVEAALELIKQHICMLQGLSIEQATLIDSLRNRNDKLNSAINVLQQQRSNISHINPDKRRKLSPKNPQIRDDSINVDSQNYDSLNMNIAMNGTQLFEETQDDESIAETETAITGSPNRRPWSVRRKFSKRNCENWLSKTATAEKPKLPLTLKNSNSKLKQTRLQYDVVKEKEVSKTNQNLYTSLKNSKHSRSLVLRAKSNNDSAIMPIHNNTKYCGVSQPTFNADDDEIFFDFTTPKKASKPSQSPISDKFESPSVVCLSPATQDIIFVDDSLDENNSMQLNTVDLMAELMRQDENASYNALLKCEANAINKQKEQAGKPNPTPWPSAPPSIKSEQLTEPNDEANESTKLPEEIERYNVDAEDEEPDEEEFPRPILIKREHELRNRFNIDCQDCAKFVKFMGSNLTDKQVEHHLSKCKHREERAVIAHETPDDFWNPHMMSLAADDPRNEVLVDTRFAEKARFH